MKSYPLPCRTIVFLRHASDLEHLDGHKQIHEVTHSSLILPRLDPPTSILSVAYSAPGIASADDQSYHSWVPLW